MSLLGYSQPTLVQYVISLSKKASSPSDIYNNLKEMGVLSSDDTDAFSEVIFRNRKSSGSNLYRQKEEEAAKPARKQRTYKLLEADDDNVNDERGGSVSVTPPKSKKTDKKVKNFRKKSESQ